LMHALDAIDYAKDIAHQNHLTIDTMNLSHQDAARQIIEYSDLRQPPHKAVVIASLLFGKAAGSSLPAASVVLANSFADYPYGFEIVRRPRPTVLAWVESPAYLAVMIHVPTPKPPLTMYGRVATPKALVTASPMCVLPLNHDPM